jgi:hypothetical protein
LLLWSFLLLLPALLLSLALLLLLRHLQHLQDQVSGQRLLLGPLLLLPLQGWLLLPWQQQCGVIMAACCSRHILKHGSGSH